MDVLDSFLLLNFISAPMKILYYLQYMPVCRSKKHKPAIQYQQTVKVHNGSHGVCVGSHSRVGFENMISDLNCFSIILNIND